VVITLLQVVFFVGTPGVIIWLCHRSKLLNAISPVVLCYVLGIVFGNVAGLDRVGVTEAAETHIEVVGAPGSAGATAAPGTAVAPGAAEPAAEHGPGELSSAEKTTNLIAGLGVIFALGLLLVSTDFKKWLRLAPVTLLGAVLAMVSVIIVAGGAALALRSMSEELWQVAGMLVGVYTGGTVNLAAVARALDVNPVTWGVVHTADVLVCGVWFLVLLGIGPWFFGLFLPRFRASGDGNGDDEVEVSIGWLDVVKSLGVGLGLAAVPLIASQLIAPYLPSLEEPVAILGVTTVAIGVSFFRPIREVVGLYESGDYLLLVFCVAVGSLATWSRLANAEPFLMVFTGIVVLGSVALHAVLCALFRVDRDTTIITSVAALFGPPFVPPVAAALKNREIVVSGVTSGLVGLAAGNYLGLAVAYGVRWLGGFA
jgi:uncharacterized membrane protein